MNKRVKIVATLGPAVEIRGGHTVTTKNKVNVWQL